MSNAHVQRELRANTALPRDMGANCLNNLSAGWYHAESSKRPAIDHSLPIDEYFVLAVASVNHLDIDS